MQPIIIIIIILILFFLLFWMFKIIIIILRMPKLALSHFIIFAISSMITGYFMRWMIIVACSSIFQMNAFGSINTLFCLIKFILIFLSFLMIHFFFKLLLKLNYFFFNKNFFIIFFFFVSI